MKLNLDFGFMGGEQEFSINQESKITRYNQGYQVSQTSHRAIRLETGVNLITIKAGIGFSL